MLELNKIHNTDCLEFMKTLPDDCIDAIVTDPPYGLSFMGKKWDYEVPSVEIWKEALRVLKPGGYLLSFAGTRTQHRMACNIEDAGFEIRDMIAWVYGSGFPKSLNIGKAVDKISERLNLFQPFAEHYESQRKLKGLTHNQICEIGKFYNNHNHGGASSNWATGANVPTLEQYKILKPLLELSDEFTPLIERIEKERELIGKDKNWGEKGNVPVSGYGEFEITKGNSEWEGWGTALKPSHEDITLAQKPFDTRSDLEYTVGICQTLLVQIAKRSSELNLNEKTQQSIALLSVDANIKVEDLLEVMVMLQSGTKENTSLSIVLSWLKILAETWIAQNMSTISTKLSLTIELKILQSLEWENILVSTMQANESQTNGLSADVYNVDSILTALKLKLNYTLEHFAEESVMLSEKLKDLRPSLEPITVARKPLSEKSVAENVLKWGTGGINIDGSRVETTEDLSINGNRNNVKSHWGNSEGESKVEASHLGRFPANFIHDGSDEVVDLLNDNARFFYCPKASKSERNKGCEELEEKFAPKGNSEGRNMDNPKNHLGGMQSSKMSNNHPTVKPVALMEYLVKLVSKEGAIILDPFTGSGSTLIACKNLKRNYIGVELEPDYVKIAEERVKSISNTLFN